MLSVTLMSMNPFINLYAYYLRLSHARPISTGSSFLTISKSSLEEIRAVRASLMSVKFCLRAPYIVKFKFMPFLFPSSQKAFMIHLSNRNSAITESALSGNFSMTCSKSFLQKNMMCWGIALHLAEVLIYRSDASSNKSSISSAKQWPQGHYS